jgi:hypothetical protein
MTYTPRKDSIAHQVIEHLTANPGATLTAHDLAAKFGKPAARFCSILSAALHANIVKLATNGAGELAYSLGTGTPTPKLFTPVTTAPYITGKPRTVWVEVQQRGKVAA